MKNGEVFSGIFFGASLEGTDQAYLLKMVQKVRSNDKVEPNGSPDTCGDFIGSGEDYDMSFGTKDVVHLAVDGVSFDIREKAQNGTAFFPRTCDPDADEPRPNRGLPYRCRHLW